MAEPSSITYASGNPSLPGSDFSERLQGLRIQRLFAAQTLGYFARSSPREMGHNGLHSPRSLLAPRPSWAQADDVDAQTFRDRQDAERSRATQPKPTSQEDRTMSDDFAPR